jgi:hypothetical protein
LNASGIEPDSLIEDEAAELAERAAALPSSKVVGRSTTLGMLLALNFRLGDAIYPGTADPVRVAASRAANKRARKARRVFRARNARKGVR